MCIVLPKYKLSYFPVPKIACTSIKQFFFELEHGRTFSRLQANGERKSVHHIYPTQPFEDVRGLTPDDYLKLAVVRDPVKRFLSCYVNRVLEHNRLGDWIFTVSAADKRKGIVNNPDIDQYIAHFHRYRELSNDIQHHSNLMVKNLGTDPSYFTHLFNINELDDFIDTVRMHVGHAPEMGRFQVAKTKISAQDLSAAQRKYIIDYYAEDYRIFGRYL